MGLSLAAMLAAEPKPKPPAPKPAPPAVPLPGYPERIGLDEPTIWGGGGKKTVALPGQHPLLPLAVLLARHLGLAG